MQSQALHQIFSLGMAPLWVCSIALLALSINRFRALRRSQVIDTASAEKVCQRAGALDFAGAEAEARKSASLVNQAWADGLREVQLGGVSVQEAVTSATVVALKPLRRNLNHISTIGVIAPMFGLIGTVVGMIMTFAALAATGTADKTQLAEGLSFALYKTAGGLIVAIPAIVLGRYFQGVVASYSAEAEAWIQKLHYADMHGKARSRNGGGSHEEATEIQENLVRRHS
jgi:biopolymer transport protein ExbB